MECKLDNITVFYETFGEGRPIVLLHGMQADHSIWQMYFEPIFENRPGWKRIYPDLPGMGKTPGKDWIKTQDDVLDVVLNFIDNVVPEQNVTIAGWSYGGYLAQGVVYQRPELVDGLFLVAPVHDNFVRTGEVTLPSPITLVEDKSLIEKLEPNEVEIYNYFFTVQDIKFLDGFKDFLRAQNMADQNFLDRLGENSALSFNVDELEKPFGRPALIITGRQDSVTGYHEPWNILENYPRATFAVLDRAGHPLPAEQERLVQVMVGEWLDRLEESIR